MQILCALRDGTSPVLMVVREQHGLVSLSSKKESRVNPPSPHKLGQSCGRALTAPNKKKAKSRDSGSRMLRRVSLYVSSFVFPCPKTPLQYEPWDSCDHDLGAEFGQGLFNTTPVVDL